jgi:hypothetical protein
MLTDAQKTTLAAALRAETDQTVVDALAIRNDMALTAWCNTVTATDAWHHAMTKGDLFTATDITNFDALTAGKRDAWRLLMENAPIDMRRNEMRKVVKDVWGGSLDDGVLAQCTRKATKGELYLGSIDISETTVTAKKLEVPGTISLSDVSDALNRNPA